MPLSSFSLVFGHDSRPYRLRRHDRDLQTPVTGLLRPGLGFGQVTFPDDAFVRFVDTLDPVLILARTLRQFLGDLINTAVGEAAHWGQELYSLTDVKFMDMHGVSAPTRKRLYHTRGGRVLGHHGGGEGKRHSLRAGTVIEADAPRGGDVALSRPYLQARR